MAARVAVLAVAAAGIAAFSAIHKTVTVTVDGVSHEVTTFASSVEGVLAHEHVVYPERDLVAPAPAAPVPRS
ncbi:MAG: ubiquitin-like domain-containing protein, partial [Bifidobacteriaceae bacterium]|nr:ubiquitin-like domain-containing protein [Bifidobacteriaceae bacterium]